MKPETFETFYSRIGDPRKEHSCFNGEIKVIKYRVTVEEIPESIEVIHARLEDLWLHCDNHHHYNSLKEAAKKHNYEFKGEWGSLHKSIK
jgi:hypothetical protein